VKIFGIYIGHPLRPGKYFLFPYFGIVAYHKIKMDQQKITIKFKVKFYDCTANLSADLYFAVENSAKFYYESGATNLIRQQSENLVDVFSRYFFWGIYLKLAAKMAPIYSLEFLTTAKYSTVISPYAKLMVNYDHGKTFPQNYRQLREIITDLPAEKDLHHLYKSSFFYYTLKNIGVRPLKIKIYGFEEAIKQQEQEIEQEKQREERKKREAYKQEKIAEATASSQDICENCLTINPIRCKYCKRCLKCYGNYSGECDDCYFDSSDDD
jgi:hypothetical protein